MSKKNGGMLTLKDIRQKYGLVGVTLPKDLLPAAEKFYFKGPVPCCLWTPETVEKAMSTPKGQALLKQVEAQPVVDWEDMPQPPRRKGRRRSPQKEKERRKRAKERKAEQRRLEEEERERQRELAKKPIWDHLLRYDVAGLLRTAQALDRRFILHCGPTNSGKTYNALLALKGARTGCYLGPLRLLALEVFDTLNDAGCPCSLLTGEESIEVPFSQLTSSTIEMCDFSTPVEVAVIDEAQLIASRQRGGHWLNALLRVPAREVHVCVAPEGLELVTDLIRQTGSHWEVHHYERLTPLTYAGTIPANHYEKAQPGDAFIAFSRKAVLGIAAELDSLGIKASVIYGALPPQSRREEVRKFAQGENTVVVATDAIGMGVSLPIRRVVFCQTTKFDGLVFRPLNVAEIKQIAGRAGRFGKHPEGLVVTMENGELVQSALEQVTPPFRAITIPFPKEALGGEFSMPKLLAAWDDLPPVPGFFYEDMSEARTLYVELRKRARQVTEDCPEEEILKCLTCPVDLNNYTVVRHWVELTVALLSGQAPPAPRLCTDTLTDCETAYKLLDLQRQMLSRFGIKINVGPQKRAVEERINELLSQDKSDMRRVCKRCGALLPPTALTNVCERCHKIERARVERLREEKRRLRQSNR